MFIKRGNSDGITSYKPRRELGDQPEFYQRIH